MSRHPTKSATGDGGRDYLIVGGGAAGCVLAARLSENPAVHVTLLEAGPDYRSAEAPADMRASHWALIADLGRHPQYQWPSLTARRTPSRPLEHYMRGRGIGGSSAINGMVAIRPPLNDFDAWGAGWSADTALASFVRLERDIDFPDAAYHGADGPIPVARAAPDSWASLDTAFRDGFEALGLPRCEDVNAPGSTGVSPLPYNGTDGRRIGTADGYLEPARNRANLEVIGDALVERVLFDRRRAIGVVARIGGEQRRLEASETIVCAGAIHSPAILQRSGAGPAALLRQLGIDVIADLPVGEGFQEHPHVAFLFALGGNLRGADNGRHTNVCARWSSGEPGTKPNDMMAITNGPAPGAPALASVGLWVNQAFSRGHVAIRTADPAVDPEIGMNLVTDRRDLTRLAATIDIAAAVLDHPTFAQAMTGAPCGVDGTRLDRLVQDRADREQWVRQVADGSAHASATCPIGAVVDAGGRVFGVENLRVIDMSIAPSAPRANTHLTAIMLAEHIAASMRDGDDAQLQHVRRGIPTNSSDND